MNQANHEARGRASEALALAGLPPTTPGGDGEYENLAEHLAVGVFRVTADDEGLIVHFNPAFMRLFEADDLDDLMGRSASMLHADPARRRRAVDQILNSPRGTRVEVDLVTLKGRKFPAAISGAIRRIGGRDFIEGVIEDITERRQREAERKQAEADARELALNRVQFRMAREIQQRLLPAGPPPLTDYDLAAGAFPAEIVGGDYFDYIPFLDGQLGIVIGDASGHSLGAAMLAAETRSYLWALAQTYTDLNDILARTNTLLHAGTPEACFVTLIIAKLDPPSGRLELCSCGHPAALVVAPTGAIRAELHSTNCPLGCMDFWDPAPPHRLQLQPGERLVMLTDGILESRDPAGRFLGAERVRDAVGCCSHLPSLEMINSVYESVCQFCRGDPSHDDMTLVVLRRLAQDALSQA